MINEDMPMGLLFPARTAEANEARLKLMFPNSHEQMAAAHLGRTSNGRPLEETEAKELQTEIARLKEAAKTDPALQGELARAYVRAGKEAEAVRRAGGNPRAAQLRRMFPNSYDAMTGGKK